MKKIFLPIILAISTILVSCTDPVFYYITKDVASETATVNGIIRSIARFSINDNEYIVTTNTDGIIYKLIGTKNGTDFTFDETTQSHGEWKTLSQSQLPFELHSYDYTNATHKGQQILKIVADSDNLYVFTTSYKIYSDKGTSCPEKFYIYKVKPTESEDGTWLSSESDWEEIFDSNDSIDKSKIIYTYDDYCYTAINIFSSNSPIKSERKVLLRIGDESSNNGKIQYFEINDGIATEKIISASEILDSDSAGEKVSLNGIAILDGKTYYAKSRALTTNATFTKEATAMYWGQSEYLYYKTKSSEITKSVDANYTISSLGICEDAIIIGRGQNSSSNISSSGGVEKVQFTKDDSGEYTNIPEDKLGSFTTNAQTQLLTSYLVQTMFNSTPGKKELDSALYASLYFIGSGSSTSVSFKNIGLWSYYPTRANWNRE